MQRPAEATMRVEPDGTEGQSEARWRILQAPERVTQASEEPATAAWAIARARGASSGLQWRPGWTTAGSAGAWGIVRAAMAPTFADTQISGIDLNLTRYEKKWSEGVIFLKNHPFGHVT